MPRNRAAYMREYMRARRGSTLTTEPPAPKGNAWLPKLRRLYAALLRAQASLSAFQSDALRVGDTGPLPVHLTAALDAANAALDAHEALNPELAREFYARHEAHALTQQANRLERDLHAAPRPPVGRPARPLAAFESAAFDAYRRLDAARAAHERALAGPALPPLEASRIERELMLARAADDRAAEALTKARRRAQEAEARAAVAQADREATEATIATLRAQAAALTAPWPVVRAPAVAPVRSPDPDRPGRLRAARDARHPVPVTGPLLATLSMTYGTERTPDGRTVLVRRATGRTVRAAKVRAPGGPWVRTADLLDALAPCGLV